MDVLQTMLINKLNAQNMELVGSIMNKMKGKRPDELVFDAKSYYSKKSFK